MTSINTGELRALPVLGIRDVFPGDSVADLDRGRAGPWRPAVSRRRHSRGQAQDRLQGGRPHGGARFGEALRGRQEFCSQQRRGCPASWSWPCARPSAWCARSTSSSPKRARAGVRQQRRGCFQRGWRQDRGVAARRRRPLGGANSSNIKEAHGAAHSGDHCRQLWPPVARGFVRRRDRRCRHEGDPRLSRQARSLRLQNARHGRSRGRRIGVRRRSGLRQRCARSGLYNPGVSVSSRAAAARASWCGRQRRICSGN